MNRKETRNITIRNISEDENYFEGRACQYNVKDSYGTTFMAGCFTRGGLDTRSYSLLWNHDYSKPVGTFVAEEREDGLYIVGRWDDNTSGRDARASALSGSASDLSVGFTWMQESEEDAAQEIIRKARLHEVSQVTSRFGAVPGSAMTAVRNNENTEDEERWTTVYPTANNPEQGTKEAEQEETQTIAPEATEVVLTVEETEVEQALEEPIAEAIEVITEPEAKVETEPEPQPEEEVKSGKKKKVNKSIVAINNYIQSLF
jgi:HK97 family phage prohead protease